MPGTSTNNHQEALKQLTLGNSLLNAGRIDEAIEHIQEAMKRDRRNVDAFLMLGNAYQGKRDYASAIQLYLKALKLNHSVPALYNNLANARVGLGELHEALSLYQKALSLEANYADAYFNMGNTYLALKQYDEAVACYQQLLQKQPNYYRAWTMLGMTLKAMGRQGEALQAYHQALNCCPDNTHEKAVTLFNLGNLYQAIREFDPAAQCYAISFSIQEALSNQTKQTHPLIIPTLSSLATILGEQGKTEEAISLYHLLGERFPGNPIYRLNALFKLPVVYKDRTDIENWRNRFEATLDDLCRNSSPQGNLGYINEEVLNGLAASGFYLSYQGMDDLRLQQKIAQLFRKVRAPYIPLPVIRNRNTQRPKIGFVSRHLSRQHTIGKLMQGIVQQLSRDSWDVRIFVAGETTAIDQLPSHELVRLPNDNLRESRRLILAEEPDLLFYCDIGMDPLTKFLANERLAPVQCAVWGHPVTTGLPTMDYFISSKLVEPENAQAHYSENLVLLDTLPTYYYRPSFTPPADTDPTMRERLSLPPDGHIYLCPQALFKFHPDFDEIIRQILEADSKGYLILLMHYSQGVQQQLIERFKQSMPLHLLDRIRWVNRLQHDVFLQLMASADVMLDSLHFGGGNTSYEALAFGVPVITLPGEFMRGRITAGCYNKMGFTECIAQNIPEYIEKALRFGQDPAERQRVHVRILATCSVLYEDSDAIQALDNFFHQALARI